MKRNLTLALLFSGILSASAQIPFPSSNATWTQRHGNGEAAPSYTVYGLKTDEITIGAYTYKKLYKSENDLVLDASEYCGGLREDATHRVYYYDASTSSEHLLYDFSLSVGDTLYSTSSVALGIVDEIDTLTISGVDHRRINFRQAAATTPMPLGAWVEGIGNTSLGGLLGPLSLQPTCDCATTIVCFSDAAATDYHNPMYSSTDCSTVFSTAGITHFGHDAGSITLSPNPVTGISHIQITGSASYKRLTVSDMLGKTLISSDIEGKSTITIDKGSLAPGMYIYRLQNDAGKTVMGKFVIE